MEKDQVKRTLGSRFSKKQKTREELLKEIINHLEKMDRAKRIDENKIGELKQIYGEQLVAAANYEVKKQLREQQQQQVQKSSMRQMWESTLEKKGLKPRQPKSVELLEAQLNRSKKIFKGQSIDDTEINRLIKHYGIETVNRSLNVLNQKGLNSTESNFTEELKEELIHSEKMSKSRRIYNQEIKTLQQHYGTETVNEAMSKLEQRLRLDQQQQSQKSPTNQRWESTLEQKGNIPRKATFIELLKEELIHSKKMDKSWRIGQNTQHTLERTHGREMVSRAENVLESLLSAPSEEKLTGTQSLFDLSSTRNGTDQQALNNYRQQASFSSESLSSFKKQNVVLNPIKEETISEAHGNANNINDQNNDTSGMDEYYQ